MSATAKHPRPSSASTDSFGPLGRARRGGGSGARAFGHLAAHALIAGASLLAALVLLAAPSAAAAAGCPNEAIREEQGSTYLPDCMALEMATPPQKGNRAAYDPMLSRNGGRLQFLSIAPLGETEGLRGPIEDTYVAERVGQAWRTFSTAPPADLGFGWGEFFSSGAPKQFAPDLGRWFSVQGTIQQALLGEATAFEATLDGGWVPRSPLLVPHNVWGKARYIFEEVNGQNFAGVSADGSHLVLYSNTGTTEPAPTAPAYLAGDPEPARVGTAVSAYSAPNEYVLKGEAAETSISLLTRDSNGKVWGGECGAFLGGGFFGVTMNGKVQGAISADGSRMYFTTRPATPEGMPCPATGKAVTIAGSDVLNLTAGAQTFAVGEEVTGGSIPTGTVVTAISGSQLTLSATPAATAFGVEVKGAGPIRIMERAESAGETTISELIPDGPAAGSDHFEGASLDGSRVYFTSSRKLAPTDGDPASAECSPEILIPTTPTSQGCDLYLYERLPGGGHEIVQVSAGGAGDPTPGEGADVYQGVTAISGDGSHVYFAAQGVLTTDPNPEGAVARAGRLNLYMYERDSGYPAGRLSFVGELDSNCSLTASGQEPDCSQLAGVNLGSLTTRSLGRGPARISFSNTSATAVPVLGVDAAGNQVGGDGHILVFQSDASLTANDQDGGRSDVYRYDGDAVPPSLDCVSCVGSADSAPFDASIPIPGIGSHPVSPGPEFAERGRRVNEDGDSIVFSTAEPLVAYDTDGQENPYLWRNGALTQLPGTTGAVAGSWSHPAPTVSASGDEVAFESPRQLVPEDGDEAVDIYVARVDGGHPNPPPVRQCSGESCQGPPAAALPTPASGTSTLVGSGNVKPSAKKKKHRRHHKVHRRHHKGKSHHGAKKKARHGGGSKGGKRGSR